MAVDLDPDRGEDGRGLVAGGGDPTCATAAPKTSPGIVPTRSGGGGSWGYSSTGMSGRANRLLPASIRSLEPSRTRVTGLFGRVRAMSESNRPCTSTRPSWDTWAGAVIRAETS